jgi:hypothetical protein
MMKRRLWILTVAVLVVCVGHLFAIADDEDEGEEREAVITYVRGEVEKNVVKDDKEWEQAIKRDKMVTGNKVRTHEDGRSEIRLADRTVIRMDDSSQITLATLQAEKDAEKTTINLEEGKVWATVAKLSDKSDFKISSQVAGASIRGTTFEIAVNKKGETQVKVHRGKVEVYNPLAVQEYKEGEKFEGPREVVGPSEVAPAFEEISREEWTYMIGKQMQVTIGKDGELVSKGKFKKDEDDEWVRWNKEMDVEAGLYK